MRKYYKYIFFILIIVILDQLSKIAAHIYLSSGKIIKFCNGLLELNYVLNEGMAFGIKLGFKYGKLVLTFTRIFLSISIIKHIKKLVDRRESAYLIISWSLIISGAIGNSIDGIFYGLLFNNASSDAPIRLFYGKVIDMIAIDTTFIYKFIRFIPIINKFNLIPTYPVFNIADIAISAGVIILIFIEFLNKKDRKAVS